jgi:uncharacterized linocin/CFP29 family protein
MELNSVDVGWSDEQWARARKTIQTEAEKARVAAQFLPVNQERDVTAVAVPDRRLGVDAPAGPGQPGWLSVDSTPSTFVTSLAVNVGLSSQEISDPDQGSALIQFRRAANIIARLEDALIFRGQPRAGEPPAGVERLPPVFQVGGGGAQPGLSATAPQPYHPRLHLPVKQQRREGRAGDPTGDEDLEWKPFGRILARRIIDAIGELEAAGHNKPFACVLGQEFYSRLHDPSDSLVLPRDRVLPFLDGPLLRSSTLAPTSGVVVALGGSPMEIVVSSDLKLRFLQITTEPRFVFRISERIALRVTDWSAIAVLDEQA